VGDWVLVVEDDEDLRANVGDILSLEGYEVVLAAHGGEALEVLRCRGEADAPCCVLLDLMMPVMDGRTFLETLAAESPHLARRLEVVVWTAGRSEQVSAGLPLPVRLLRKPADLDALLAAVADPGPARAC
jgi:CheY-like chemotaxis protein